VMNIAKKYTSMKIFKEENYSAFISARSYGFIKEMAWLL
jgi:hypothetical protein